MKSQWENQSDLVRYEETLYVKICLLALMEMTFQRSATDRSLTFQDIASQTGLEEDKVELLVMKALAKGLVKGSIDQVAQVANLTWVQPRVLDKEQLKILVKKVNEFTTSINFMENMIETNASDILTM
jgi:26S proteasome regulatory subunit N9